MAGTVVRVDISDQNEIIKRLERISPPDLTPAFMAIGETHLATVQERFERETDPYGKRWTLRKTPLRGRGRQGDPRRKLLFLTGRLRNSLIYKASPTDVVIGTNLIYAATHQFGRGAIPARPYLDITERDAVRYVAILVEYIEFLLES